MPFIRISVAGNAPSVDQVIQLQRKTTQLMADILRKRPDVTVITVESSGGAQWAVGGKQLAEDQRLVQMEAFITAGTNSREEKSDFISAAHQMLTAVLNAPISPLYVVIIEVDGADWGYDGKTQAARRQTAQPL